MFNFWNPFNFTSPNTGIPTGNGFGPWTTWNTNPYSSWNTNPYTNWWSGTPNFGSPIGNPWHSFFQAFFVNFFEAFTAWQIQMISMQNSANYSGQQGVPGFPHFGPNFRNGWTGPTQDFAGTGYTQRNA